MLWEWIMAKLDSFRRRRRMRSRAKLLVKVRECKPEVLSYLESLEYRVDSQEKEMRRLRWALEGEQMANWDLVLDVREARLKRADDSLQAE